MIDDEVRQRLAATFDQSAPLYQRARPAYPRELYDRLVDVTGLKPGAKLLEIGCATGKATLPFVRRGFRITCLEPGGRLAAEARRLLAPFDVEVIVAASGLFDIVDIRQYDWEVTYDAESYIALLNTFSGHIAMRDWQRDRLYGEIRRRLALRPHGRLRRHWAGVLHIARRRGD